MVGAIHGEHWRDGARLELLRNGRRLSLSRASPLLLRQLGQSRRDRQQERRQGRLLPLGQAVREHRQHQRRHSLLLQGSSLFKCHQVHFHIISNTIAIICLSLN
jgi:hypothetical protein